MKPDCPHYQLHTKDGGLCLLTLYGGKPSHGTCQQCISKGQNNEAYAKELFAKAELTHPSGRARISGCCDSAKNYPDRI